MNIYVETYGCSANIHEGEVMKGLLQKAGFEVVASIGPADLVIINSCVVKTVTEQKLLYRLNEIRKKYPEKKLIVTGCAPETIKDKLLDIDPDMNLVSTHQIKKIAQAAKKVLEGKHIELIGETADVKLMLPKIRENPVIGIVPISSGCAGACTYCLTRLAKGKLFSYPKVKIIDEISSCVSSGCREIWLTAQDTGAYGLDKYDQPQLPKLLKEISKIPGNFFTRIGMMNPSHVKTMLSDLIEALNSRKIYKFIHIPIQSGNNEILEQMNRQYTVEDFEEIAKSFRDAFRCTIWTDLIIGYPGETDEQFKDSLEFIKRIEPDWVNISRFAKREGTEAAKLKQLDTDVMKKRTSIASDLVENMALRQNKQWIDWQGEILITEKGKKPGQWIGRNFAYKPVVINKSGDLLGKIIKVKIIDAVPSTLVGWPIKQGGQHTRSD